MGKLSEYMENFEKIPLVVQVSWNVLVFETHKKKSLSNGQWSNSIIRRNTQLFVAAFTSNIVLRTIHLIRFSRIEKFHRVTQNKYYTEWQLSFRSQPTENIMHFYQRKLLKLQGKFASFSSSSSYLALIARNPLLNMSPIVEHYRILPINTDNSYFLLHSQLNK